MLWQVKAGMCILELSADTGRVCNRRWISSRVLVNILHGNLVRVRQLTFLHTFAQYLLLEILYSFYFWHTFLLLNVWKATAGFNRFFGALDYVAHLRRIFVLLGAGERLIWGLVVHTLLLNDQSVLHDLHLILQDLLDLWLGRWCELIVFRGFDLWLRANHLVLRLKSTRRLLRRFLNRLLHFYLATELRLEHCMRSKRRDIILVSRVVSRDHF